MIPVEQPPHPLVRYRAWLGISQDDLADRLGCSQTLICLIEAGKRPVTESKADAWSLLTGIARDALLAPAEHDVDPKCFIRCR